jgi:small subunit ribosomal protein S17
MSEQARRKARVGRVVGDKMDKTVVVAVERRVQHPLYRKSIKHVTKFKAHDVSNSYHVGDLVRIEETRPLSRTKRWRVAELLERPEAPELTSGAAIAQAAVADAPAVAEAAPAEAEQEAEA